MGKGWWWQTAAADKRLVFALLMLIVTAALIFWAAADPDAFFSGVKGWVFVIASPLLAAFLLFQAWRAWRELRG